MPTDSDQVQPLRRASELSSPLAADLTHLTPELAAMGLVDRFAETGYAQAQVMDPATVRALVRRDCRQRHLRVRTLGAGRTVVLVDEHRHDAWLLTPAGRAQRRQQEDIALAAFESLPGPGRPLMSIDPTDD